MSDEKDKPEIVLPTPDSIAQFGSVSDPKTGFTDLLIRIDPTAEAMLFRARCSLPTVANSVALTCFIEQKAGADVDELRRQLKHLQTFGVFDFKHPLSELRVIDAPGVTLPNGDGSDGDGSDH